MHSITKIKHQFILKINSALCLLLLGAFYGCIEPYEGVVADYENVLVVNSILTNENKIQQVNLSRSYRFEEEGPQAERNATVSILAGDGEEFTFKEKGPGKYYSNTAFAALPNIDYRLSIITSDGRSYTSESMQLPESVAIDDVYAERTTDENGAEGVGIYVDSFDPSGKAQYYHFDYEETYKIIAPYWSPNDAVVTFEGATMFGLNVILREREEQVCYGTDTAKEILIKNTLSLSEDRLSRYNVRFIEKENFILTYRYSILVKQYIQNPLAYAYYETLQGLSKSSENIFSEDQPGFLSGNLFALDDSGENVAGFFEVASVDTKRIFFNYEDFFPGEEKPPYFKNCNLMAPTTSGRLGERSLLNHIYDDDLRFYDYNFNSVQGEGPFLMVQPECGDCTVLGSNKVPDFWVE